MQQVQRKFSVVTATFNPGALWERTAQSIAAQTFRSFEWIVVDGGSNDGTVDRIRANPDVHHWISEPDGGIADAWNKGIGCASGEYVLLLNAGDTYDSGFLAAINPLCDGEHVVCSHARLCDESGRDVGLFKARPEKLRWAMHVPHNWCAVPTKHYRDLGLYSLLPLAMDFEWFHRYYRRHREAGFIVLDQVLGTYHLGGTSDLNYTKSFRANEKILRENGMHPLLAHLIRLAYTAKHSMRSVLR